MPPSPTMPCIEKATRILAKHGLPYYCKSNTEGDGNCFFHAICDQLTNEKIWRTIFPSSKEFTNSHLAIRRAVVKFARQSDDLQRDETVIAWLKIEQEKPVNKGKTTEQIWEEYLRHMSEDGTWANEVIIRAAAMFFGKDIFVISESTAYFVYGSMTGQKTHDPPMVLVHMNGTHFQSVHMIRTPKENSDNTMEAENGISQDTVEENHDLSLLKFQAEYFREFGKLKQAEEAEAQLKDPELYVIAIKKP